MSIEVGNSAKVSFTTGVEQLRQGDLPNAIDNFNRAIPLRS